MSCARKADRVPVRHLHYDDLSPVEVGQICAITAISRSLPSRSRFPSRVRPRRVRSRFPRSSIEWSPRQCIVPSNDSGRRCSSTARGAFGRGVTRGGCCELSNGRCRKPGGPCWRSVQVQMQEAAARWRRFRKRGQDHGPPRPSGRRRSRVEGGTRYCMVTTG